MKDLLAVITPVAGESLGPAAKYALAVGALCGAHVAVLITEIEPISAVPQSEPDNMQGGMEPIAFLSVAERIARTTELFQVAANHAAVPCTILPGSSRALSLRETLIAVAQVRDAVILDFVGPLIHPRRSLVEGVLLGAGRPIILVPPPARVPGNVVVGWDSTRAAVRAMHDAMPLLTRADKVFVVTVIDDKDLRSPDSGTELAKYLWRWGVDAHYHGVTRQRETVGSTLLGHAQRMDAQLLVMGGFGHAREREFIFGSATKDIFETNLKMPVLLSH